MSKSKQIDLMTPAEASRVIGLTPQTVKFHADAGRLETIRTASGNRLITRESVERFAEERRQRGAK